jgi:hypothetical protein
VRRGTGHAAGFGQGMSRALSTPRPPGCVSGQLRTAPPRPADASRSVRIAGGEIELDTAVWGGHAVDPTPSARTATDTRRRRRIIREDVGSSPSAPPASARAARGPEIDVAARSSARPAVCAEGQGALSTQLPARTAADNRRR